MTFLFCSYILPMVFLGFMRRPLHHIGISQNTTGIFLCSDGFLSMPNMHTKEILSFGRRISFLHSSLQNSTGSPNLSHLQNIYKQCEFSHHCTHITLFYHGNFVLFTENVKLCYILWRQKSDVHLSIGTCVTEDFAVSLIKMMCQMNHSYSKSFKNYITKPM
jgi:hypothetical protein